MLPARSSGGPAARGSSISPSPTRNPSASSSSLPGVRIVTARASPPTRISSGSSTATSSRIPSCSILAASVMGRGYPASLEGERERAAEEGCAGAEERDVVADAPAVEGAEGVQGAALVAQHVGGEREGDRNRQEREQPVVRRWRRQAPTDGGRSRVAQDGVDDRAMRGRLRADDVGRVTDAGNHADRDRRGEEHGDGRPHGHRRRRLRLGERLRLGGAPLLPAPPPENAAGRAPQPPARPGRPPPPRPPPPPA